MANNLTIPEVQQARLARYAHFAVPTKNNTAFADEQPQPQRVDGGSTMERRSNCIDNIAVSKAILEQTPDMKRAVNILTAFILCPTGATKPSILLYSGDELASDVKEESARMIMEEINSRYIVRDRLIETLYGEVLEILSTTGGKVRVILPDTSLDEIINASTNGAVTLQSLASKNLINLATSSFNPIGFLSTPTRAGTRTDSTLQSAFTLSKAHLEYNPVIAVNKDNNALTGLLSFTDNPDILKMPRVLAANTRVQTQSTLQAYNTSRNSLNPNVTLRRDYKDKNSIFLTTPDKFNSSYTSLEVEYPVYCTVPVRDVSSNEIVAYVLIHDGMGSPLKEYFRTSSYQDLTSDVGHGSDPTGTNSLSQKQTRTLNMSEFTTRKANSLENADRALFCQALRNELLSRLNGKNISESYKGNYELLVDDDVLSVAMSRAMEHQRTQFLYVPAQLVNYHAYHFDEYGMGMSVVATTKLMSNLRSVLWIANFMRSLEDAIDSKRLNVTLDPDDTNANGSLEKIVDRYIAMNSSSIPGMANRQYGFGNMIQGLQRNRLSVNITNASELEDIPAQKVDLEHIRRDTPKVDREILEQTQKLSLMGIGGMSPEIVDQSQGLQFSSQVTRENSIQGRIIADYQGQASESITDRVRKKSTFDGEFISTVLPKIKITASLRKEIADLLPPNADDEMVRRTYLEYVISKTRLVIPTPEDNALEATAEKLADFGKVVDELLRTMENDSFAGALDDDENLSNMSRDLFRTRAALAKKALMRTYIQTTKGIPSYLEAILDPEESNGLVSAEWDRLLESINSTGDLMAKVTKYGAEFRDTIAKAKAENEPAEEEAPVDEPVASADDDDLTVPDTSGEAGDDEATDEEAGNSDNATSTDGDENEDEDDDGNAASSDGDDDLAMDDDLKI